MSDCSDNGFDGFEDREPPFDEGEVLVLSLDGFEGPLDLLLALSRSKKIDLLALSISELASQYILYIENLKKQRLEIAGDYLVMAAWLTFLKSKLLIPSPPGEGDELSGDELAARLAFRLKRLDAMRKCAKQLMARPQLGQDFYGRGAPEGVSITVKHMFKADSYQLFKAYSGTRRRTVGGELKVKRREVWSIKKARSRLEAMLGMPVGWAPIHDLIAAFLQSEDLQKTTVASTFGASLEMARDGVVELRQEGHFKPLYLKSRHQDVEFRVVRGDETSE